MAQGCGAKCAKMMLVVFNIIFWLSGIALLGVGIWMLVDSTLLDMLNFVSLESDAKLKYVAILLIVVGSVVAIVGIVGCVGALRESKVLLGIYIFFLCLVMAAEIAAGVLAIVFKDKIEDEINETLTKELAKDNYWNSTDKTYTAFGLLFNLVQYELKCCGVNGPKDYKDTPYSLQDPDNYPLPVTCCKVDKDKVDDARKIEENAVLKWDNCRKEYKELLADDLVTANDLHNRGCESELKDWAREKAAILIGIAIGIACLEIFGFIFALCLCRNRDK